MPIDLQHEITEDDKDIARLRRNVRVSSKRLDALRRKLKRVSRDDHLSQKSIELMLYNRILEFVTTLGVLQSRRVPTIQERQTAIIRVIKGLTEVDADPNDGISLPYRFTLTSS